MKTLLRLLFILLVNVSVTGTAGERFFRNIDSMGEYGDLTVNSIHQDPTGYVWMACDRGILRCDGIHTRFISLNKGNRPLFITSFASLPDGSIAAGTRQGIAIIDQGCNIIKGADDDIEITSLVKWSADTILAGTIHGLRAYDPHGNLLQFHPQPQVDSGSSVIAMATDSAGNIYIHTPGALLRLDRVTQKYTTLGKIISEADRPLQMVTHNHKLWAVTMSSELHEIDLINGNSLKVDIQSPVLTSLSISPDGSLYVGTDGDGVYIIDPDTHEVKDHISHSIQQTGSPASNQVYSLLAADNGVLWIGYYQHGADYSVNNTGGFEVFDNPSYFNSLGVAIRTITVGKDYMALGTRNGLLILRRDGKITTIDRPTLNSNMIISVSEYHDHLYIGTYGGGMSIHNIRTGETKGFNETKDIPFRHGHIFAITPDSLGQLWLGTSDGLYCYDGDALRHHFTSDNSKLPTGNVYEVAFDSTGRGWICTENGVCIYDPEKHLLRDDLFPEDFINHDKIRTVFEDSDNSLYFLPERGGITVSNLDMTRCIKLQAPSLDGSDAKAITEDRNGFIWITTNRGIVRWDKNDELIKFGISDGLPSTQFIQCIPTIDSNGTLWLGNSSGLVKLDTRHVYTSKTADYPLIPTSVYVDGSNDTHVIITPVAPLSYEIKLDKYSNNVSIDFSPLSFTSPDAITYEYSLDGNIWRPISYDMTVSAYNSFYVTGFKVYVRPEGNDDLVTTIDVAMPMGIALRVILGLCCIAIILIIYIIYLSLKRLKAKYDARRHTSREKSEHYLDPNRTKYRSNPISEEECARIMKQIKNVMEHDKLYTDPGLKISTLSAHTGIAAYRLSQVFSQHLNQKFYDYVNRYRVNEFKRIASHGGATRYTLTAMAEKAGFSSRASFFRHFKEIEGISPGEYLKTL